jgi:deazaflavin-dependent oxidoreductase (nitroreductase family)
MGRHSWGTASEARSEPQASGAVPNHANRRNVPRTGLRRSVVLPYLEDGDRYLVVGSHGGRPTDPIWVHNLRAHPQVWVRPRDRRWRFARAHVAQGEERERLWSAITSEGAYRYYERAAHPRLIPVVVVAPVDPAATRRPSEDRAPG